MSKLTNDDKRLIQMAISGWKQFFHYFIRLKWRIAWNELKANREQVKMIQELGYFPKSKKV